MPARYLWWWCLLALVRVQHRVVNTQWDAVWWWSLVRGNFDTSTINNYYHCEGELTFVTINVYRRIYPTGCASILCPKCGGGVQLKWHQAGCCDPLAPGTPTFSKLWGHNDDQFEGTSTQGWCEEIEGKLVHCFVIFSWRWEMSGALYQ